MQQWTNSETQVELLGQCSTIPASSLEIEAQAYHQAAFLVLANQRSTFFPLILKLLPARRLSCLWTFAKYQALISLQSYFSSAGRFVHTESHNSSLPFPSKILCVSCHTIICTQNTPFHQTPKLSSTIIDRFYTVVDKLTQGQSISWDTQQQPNYTSQIR